MFAEFTALVGGHQITLAFQLLVGRLVEHRFLNIEDSNDAPNNVIVGSSVRPRREYRLPLSHQHVKAQALVFLQRSLAPVTGATGPFPRVVAAELSARP